MNCTALSDGYCLKAKLSDIGAAQLRDLDEYFSPLSPDHMGLRHPLPTNRGTHWCPATRAIFPYRAAIWPTWERSASPTTRSTLPCPTARSTGEHALDDT
jgi:hypothetical protein